MHDTCIYSSDSAILGKHVNDIILAALYDQEIRRVKRTIAQPFCLKDLGEPRHFVGVTVDQSKVVTRIGQPAYTRRILDMFNVGEVKPVATPVDTSFNLTKADDIGETVD